MTERELLADCLVRLNRIQVEYYLTGSMASNYWGVPRTTHDLDFVVRMRPEDVGPLVREFSGEYYVDEQTVQGVFGPPHQFNLIDTRSALKVDFWQPKGEPFDQVMLSRRVKKNIGGIPAWIATAEDVILHKMVWNKISPSDRQLRDAAGVWAIQGGGLDRAYMEKWAAELGVAEELGKILGGEIRPKST